MSVTLNRRSSLHSRRDAGRASDPPASSPQEGEAPPPTVAVTRAGVEWRLPQQQLRVRLRPLGLLALFLLPCLAYGVYIFPKEQVATAVSTTATRSLQAVSHSVASVGTFFTGLYAHYRAPILRRGVIYNNTLKNDWVLKGGQHQAITLKSPGRARGEFAIRARLTHHGDALRLKVPPSEGIEMGSYSKLAFAIQGSPTEKQQLFLRTEVDGKIQKTLPLVLPKATTWQKVSLPLANLTNQKGRLTGITLFSEKPHSVFYVDNLHLE